MMSNYLIESNFSDVEILSEAASDGKKYWYIKGVYAQADVVNRNRRLYPGQVLDESMNHYLAEYVQPGRAVGELNHPDNSTINLDRVTHLTVDLVKEGSDYIGNSRILATPCGKIVEAMLEGGVKLGVSTRATGNLKRNSRGINEVQEGLRMSAIDIVYNPSAPHAFVDSLMESEIVWDSTHEDQAFIQSLKEEISSARRHELQEAKFKAMAKFFQHLRG